MAVGKGCHGMNGSTTAYLHFIDDENFERMSDESAGRRQSAKWYYPKAQVEE